MADKLTRAQRSHIMSGIRSSNTAIELKARTMLKLFGFVYQPKGIYGRPDFANKGAKVVIFIDGCFWHGCPEHYNRPKTNVAFWRNKLKRNTERDRAVDTILKSQGWHVIRVWEHAFSE